jgi:hypothetical protein
MNIVPYLTLLGLLSVTAILLVNRWVLAIALIPCLYLGYWFVQEKIPDYFGYPVPIEILDIPEARVISAFQGEKVYIVLMIKGETQPRMISLEPTEENKKMAKELSTRLKSGVAVVKKGSNTEGKSGGDSDIQGDIGDLKLVPITEQSIISKDSNE